MWGVTVHVWKGYKVRHEDRWIEVMDVEIQIAHLDSSSQEFGVENRVIARKDGAARIGHLFIYNIKYRGM